MSTARLTASASLTGTARVKHSFYRQHLLAARHFAGLAGQIELKASVIEAERSEHRAYVTGAVVFSVAFLEASINEFYLEAVDGDRTPLSSLTDQQIGILAELWGDVIDRYSILKKCQIALAACSALRFDEGAEPFQGTDGLVRIRNALIHYRPEWDDELLGHKKIRDRVEKRFNPNPLVPSGSLWFPHVCLGAGCAMWSVDQAAVFMQDFCHRLNIPSRVP
ncbi:MAG: hypothetical protein HY913_05525 [Desulfomonile tiedjei]|nr:hypothetical protein [Desulfomonile tiedjei]